MHKIKLIHSFIFLVLKFVNKKYRRELFKKQLKVQET